MRGPQGPDTLLLGANSGFKRAAPKVRHRAPLTSPATGV